jgi:hypothetical protein
VSDAVGCLQLCFKGFEQVFRNQIQLYVQRQLSNTLTMGLGSDCEVLLILVLVFSIDMQLTHYCYFAKIAQLSAIKAIFHNDAKVLARLDRIEASQVCTEGIVAEIRSVFKGLEKELCNTMAGCAVALKSASGDNWHALRSEGLAHAPCCKECKPRRVVKGRRMYHRAVAAKKQIYSAHHGYCAELGPAGVVEGNASVTDGSGEGKPDRSPVAACPTRCEQSVDQSFCEYLNHGSQSMLKDHLDPLTHAYEKVASNSAWEITSTIQAVGTLYENYRCNAYQGQGRQDEDTQTLKHSESAHFPNRSENEDKTSVSNSTRAQLELAESTNSMPSSDHQCESNAFPVQAGCPACLWQKDSCMNGPCPGKCALTTAALRQDQQCFLSQAFHSLTDPIIPTSPDDPMSPSAEYRQSTRACRKPCESSEVAAYSFLEFSPPSTPRSESSQSWSPARRRTQVSSRRSIDAAEYVDQ